MRIGTGLQNKLLEAMSMKIPAITTQLANDALCAKNGEEILVGNSSKELSDHILALLSDSELYEKLTNGGYNFVHVNHSWENATEKLNRLINKR